MKNSRNGHHRKSENQPKKTGKEKWAGQYIEIVDTPKKSKAAKPIPASKAELQSHAAFVSTLAPPSWKESQKRERKKNKRTFKPEFKAAPSRKRLKGGRRVGAKPQRPQIVPATKTLGANGTTESQDEVIKGLRDCETIDAVAELRKEWFASFREKADGAQTVPRPSEASIHLLQELHFGVATNVPIMISEKVNDIAWRNTYRDLYAIACEDPDVEFAFVTFIDGEGETSTNAPFIDLCGSRAKPVSVTRKMSKDFVGITELSVFNSHTHPDGGRKGQRHEHFLVFGHGAVRKAEAVAQQSMTKFKPNFTGARSIDVRRVEATELNLARVCAYLFKPPYQAKTWFGPNGEKPGTMSHSEAGDRYVIFIRLAQIMSELEIGDVMLAGGRGKKIRSDLVKYLRSESHNAVPAHSRPLHPDAITSFWVEVAKELNKPEWKVPIIARRP